MPIESANPVSTRPALEYKFWQITNFQVAAPDPNGSPSATAWFVPFAELPNGRRELDLTAVPAKFEIPDLYAAIGAGDLQIGMLLNAVQWVITARAEAAGIITPIANKPELVIVVATKQELQAQLAGKSEAEKLAWLNALIG